MKKFCLVLFATVNVFAMIPEKIGSIPNPNAKIIRMPIRETLLDKVDDIAYHFVGHSEDVVKHNISERFNLFKTNYNARRSVLLDLNGLSPRSCIELFKQILNYKLNMTPGNPDYWDRDIERGFYRDRIPTYLRLGVSWYRVFSEPTKNQPGNLSVEVEKNDGRWGYHTKNDERWEYHTWSEVFYPLKREMEATRENLLLTDRSLNPFQDKVVNECKILLYFEVARRLVSGDKHENFPLVVFLPYLMRNFINCEDLFVPQRSGSSLFSGDDREELLYRFVLEWKNDIWGRRWITLNDIRGVLSGLHHDDENSDCEYVEDSEDSDYEYVESF